MQKPPKLLLLNKDFFYFPSLEQDPGCWQLKNPAISANVAPFLTGQVKLADDGDSQKECHNLCAQCYLCYPETKLPVGPNGCLATGLSLSTTG